MNKVGVTPAVCWMLLPLAIVLGLLLSLSFGASSLSIEQVFGALIGNGNEHGERVVWELRLPRAVLATVVGLHFALSGCMLQALSRNPLADPGVLGISAGASLLAVMLVVGASMLPIGTSFNLQGDQLLAWLPWGALAGGILAALGVYLLSGSARLTPLKLIVTGVVCAAVLNAIMTGVLALWGQAHTETLVAWLAGSLHGRDWYHLWVILPWTLVGLIGVVITLRPLGLLRLNDEQVLSLGLDLGRWRLLVLLVATLLAASAVPVAGPIGFVGLVVPHIARGLVPGNLPHQLGISALLGALLVLVADLAGRTLVVPFELPVGVLCALIGVPAFLYLLKQQP